MSEVDTPLLLTIAFVALAFALVYSPWLKSKKYREQEAIAERHYQDALSAARSDKKCQHAWKMEGHRRRVCTKCWCVDVIVWEPEVPRAPSQDQGTGE